MSVKVTWHSSMPKEIRQTVEPLLKKYRFLIPGWCHDLSIGYGDCEGAIAGIEVKPEYRMAKMTIYQAWVRSDADYRDGTIAHELIHIALTPMQHYVETLLECWKDDPIAELNLDQWRRHYEGATDDLARSIQRALKRCA